MRKIVRTAIVLIFLLAPALSAAQTTDTAAQLQGLLAQLALLQSQIQTLKSTGASTVAEAAGTCPLPALTRNLQRGSAGPDVAALQDFLISGGYLASGNVTAYFGALTEAAVQNFQARMGIITSGTPATTGFGAVGPRTRLSIASVCGRVKQLPPPPTVPVAPPVNNSQDVAVLFFRASATQIDPGQPTTLSWSVQNAASCVITQQTAPSAVQTISVALPAAGSLVAYPLQSTAYSLICTAVGAQAIGGVRQVLVGVNASTATTTSSGTAQNMPRLAISVSPSSIQPGNLVTLMWSSERTTSCAVSAVPSGYTSTALSGSHSGIYSTLGTTTFSLTCTGTNGGTYSSSTALFVGSAQPAGTIPRLILSVTPALINTGQSALLAWDATRVSSCTVASSPSVYSASTISGSYSTIYNTAGTTTFSFTCLGLNGITYASSTALVVRATPAPSTPSLSITVPSTVAPGSNLTLSWDAQNAPQGSVVRLELVDKNTETNLGAIKSDLQQSGTSVWLVPLATEECPQTSEGKVCGRSINPTHIFAVQARLYSPAGACWFNCAGAQVATVHLTKQSSFITITPGTAVSATIDQTSLTSSSTRAFLRGVAYNTPTVAITVSNNSGVAYNSGQIPVVNSLWETRTSWLATTTQYSVLVYSASNQLLTSGTLTTGANLPWGAVIVTPSATNYGLGASITVSWNNQGAVSPTDWMTYVPENGSWGISNWTGALPRVYTSGARTGSVSMTGPNTVGRYQFVYYSSDSFNELGRSAVFTTGTPASCQYSKLESRYYNSPGGTAQSGTTATWYDYGYSYQYVSYQCINGTWYCTSAYCPLNVSLPGN